MMSWSVRLFVRILRRLRMFFRHPRLQLPLYVAPSVGQLQDLEGCLKISFVGDLILHRDMIERAKQSNGSYDFTEMFAWTAPYLRSANLSIGVLEGPIAGEECGYSNVMLGELGHMELNFPDAYLTAIRDAGINFLTTAGNHFMDKGLSGCVRTLDALDEKRIEHTGTYRNWDERKKIKIVRVGALRCAVLAYTYGTNYRTDSFFLDANTGYIAGWCPGRFSSGFPSAIRQMKSDIAAAKALGVDIIIALPHVGREFSHVPDADQRKWAKMLVENGVDVVLQAHPHATQPIEWISRRDGRRAIVVYCPGNYINSYMEKDGDASAIVEIYLNPDDGALRGASIVPLCCAGKMDANFTAIPNYEIISRKEVYESLPIAEYRRFVRKNEIVVETMLHRRLASAVSQKRYYSVPR